MDVHVTVKVSKFYLQIFNRNFAIGRNFIICFCNLYKYLEYLRYKM
jgi:hypothetical protein